MARLRKVRLGEEKGGWFERRMVGSREEWLSQEKDDWVKGKVACLRVVRLG